MTILCNILSEIFYLHKGKEKNKCLCMCPFALYGFAVEFFYLKKKKIMLVIQELDYFYGNNINLLAKL